MIKQLTKQGTPIKISHPPNGPTRAYSWRVLCKRYWLPSSNTRFSFSAAAINQSHQHRPTASVSFSFTIQPLNSKALRLVISSKLCLIQ
jgi:hypothetical protein